MSHLGVPIPRGEDSRRMEAGHTIRRLKRLAGITRAEGYLQLGWLSHAAFTQVEAASRDIVDDDFRFTIPSYRNQGARSHEVSLDQFFTWFAKGRTYDLGVNARITRARRAPASTRLLGTAAPGLSSPSRHTTVRRAFRPEQRQTGADEPRRTDRENGSAPAGSAREGMASCRTLTSATPGVARSMTTSTRAALLDHRDQRGPIQTVTWDRVGPSARVSPGNKNIGASTYA